MEKQQEKQEGKPRRMLATEAAMKVPLITKGMISGSLKAKEAGKPVAYCFIGSLYDEIVRVMGVEPVWVENYAGVCGVKRDAERFINRAEAENFSRSLCTYATCGLGYDAWRAELGGETPPDAPWGGMPEPDMILGTGLLICEPRYKWPQGTQHYVDVPVHITDIPWPVYGMDLKEMKPHYVKYITEQLQALVSFLEKQTGNKMNWDNLDEAVTRSSDTFRIWWKAFQLRKSTPAIMGTEDAMNTMVPGCFMLGTQEALDFYQALYDELKYNVDNKIWLVPDEKYRILWGAGLPPWFALADFDYFKSNYGAVFPIEVTYRPWEPEEMLEVPKGISPLERIAWRYTNYWTFRHDKAKKRPGSHPDVELLIDLIEEYNIDGIVMHQAFSCRSWHVGLRWQLNTLKKVYRDMPSLILESDIIDPRAYSEADTRMRIDAFMETVETYKITSAA